MKTDDLIEALALGLEPARPARPAPTWLAAGAVAASVGVLVLFGARPDLMAALQGPTPWLKALYTLALAGSGLWLTTRLGRPGVDARPAAVAVLAVVGLAVLGGGIELLATPPDARLADWLGRTWTVCGRNILMTSAFAGPPVFLSARALAPTRPVAAGAALGVVTGGVAATAYGLLHCPEASAAFLATWYTLGVAGAAAIGALVGRFALRW